MSADVATLEARLARAEDALERAGGAAVAAHERSESATPGGLTGYDPAILSGTRRKPNRKADNARWNAYSREAAAQRQLDDLRNDVARLRHAVADAIAERDRVRYTAADLQGATAVKDQFGWHRVVRVNAKTVSVETGFSWVDRIKVEDVLAVKL